MFGRSVVARLGRTLAAQLYGQATTILVQLALVPLLLHAWGTTTYGVWLLLSAIPFYLTFSDFGFTFIAKNEMVMAVAAGDRAAALRTFHSIFVLLNMAAPAVFALALGLILSLDVSRLLSLGDFPVGDARIVLALLTANVLLYQYGLLLGAGIRSENRPASESIWAASTRLGEGASIVIAAGLGGGLVLAAAAMVVNRLLFTVAAYLWLRRASPWITLGSTHARRDEIRRLFHPALAYMFMPVAQALLIQGPVLVIGAIMGPVAVVTFATSRTLARLGTAATNMFNNTFVTEYSAMAGRGDSAGFRRLFRFQTLVSLGVIGLYAVAIMLLNRPLMQVFTHGKVPIVEPFFLIVVLGVAAEMLWSALFTPISAVNRHRAVTHYFLLLSGIGVTLCYPLAARAGLAGAAGAVLGVQAVMVLLCLFVGKPSMPVVARQPRAVEEEDVLRTEAEAYRAG
jgi:O-antigen/teichoic acid export membrane protein